MSQTNEEYKKISWIYEMPKIFHDGILSNRRLDNFLEEEQKFLVYKIIHTLTQYFGQIPGSASPLLEKDLESSNKFIQSLSGILEIWLSGLCDLSASQIINGLMDVINLKTEYQKWPPRSVIEFYGVCKKPHPPYHEHVNKNDYKQIEFDKNKKWEQSKKIADIHLSYMFKLLGKKRKNANI
jgi:hypothetical protein